MIATALGERVSNVRDVRRTFRQSLWLIASVTPPMWLMLWNAEPLIVALGQDPGLARGAGVFLRGYMWSMLPFLAFQAMRNFVSALERPGWVLAISLAGIVLNALLGWAMIFGHLGFPAMGLFGGGLASSIVWGLLALALAAVIMTDRQFRRFHLFGRWWRPDWPRFRRLWLLGLPIGLAMGFEGGVFSAAAYLMGLISADAVAAHAVALQIAALVVHGAVGHGAGGDGARRPRARPRRPRRDRARRMERVGHGHRLHGADGAAHLGHPAPADHPVPRRQRRPTPHVIALGVSFLGIAAIFQIVDGAQVVGAGILRGLHDTRVPMIFTFIGYWLVGIGVGVWLAFSAGWGGVGIWTGLALGLAIVAVLMLVRWVRRDALGLVGNRRKKRAASAH